MRLSALAGPVSLFGTDGIAPKRDAKLGFICVAL